MTTKKSEKFFVEFLAPPKCKTGFVPGRGVTLCVFNQSKVAFLNLLRMFLRAALSKLGAPQKFRARYQRCPLDPPFKGPELLLLIELNLTVSLTVKFLFKPFEFYYKFITDCALISFQFNGKDNFLFCDIL